MCQSALNGGHRSRLGSFDHMTSAGRYGSNGYLISARHVSSCTHCRLAQVVVLPGVQTFLFLCTPPTSHSYMHPCTTVLAEEICYLYFPDVPTMFCTTDNTVAGLHQVQLDLEYSP